MARLLVGFLAHVRLLRAAVLLVALAGCGSPRVVGERPRADPELDSLAFLEGCWSYWNVDWGFRIDWRRESRGWIGDYQTYGPMAGEMACEILIEHTDALRVSSTGGPHALCGLRDIAATERAHHRVFFQRGERALNLWWDEATDVLSLGASLDELVYELRRCGARGRAR